MRDADMRGWPTVVEREDRYYVVLRQRPDREDEWYAAVLEYPPSFQPAAASVTAPPAGIDWCGPFPSRRAARAAASRAIAQGCVTPSPQP
ncbi:MAG: hypothetical protein ACE147_05570 [Candidatus Methylomirabilales bacterium]